MSFSIFPIFLLFLIWALSSSVKRKNTGKKTKGSTASPPGKKPQVQNAAGQNSMENRPGENMDARFRREFPGLYQTEMDLSQGSLPNHSTEGRDPCHDDPYAMPVGSLHTESAEGTDPCHDDWKPASARGGSPETAGNEGGLNLGWTGNEIVKGFVYGEILKRKAG